ncbi:MAG: glycosyltransferase [Eubacterium sp.]|nr:glycosyltransferase [Eubacterium sp.]
MVVFEKQKGVVERMNPKLSIIIPIYNVVSYLEQCLESVARQLDVSGWNKIEIILVDDGSTDGSAQIAERFADGRFCVQLIRQKNSGVAAARNRGMERARGEWLYFMDADDWLSGDGIRLLCEALHKCEESDIILLDAYQECDGISLPWEHFHSACEWREKTEINRLQRAVLYYPMDFPGMKVPLAAPWDKLYRRAFLLRHGIAFCEKLAVLDDMVFNMEAFGKARKISYETSKVYHYRRVADSITNSYKADRVAKDGRVWRCIEDYYEREQAEGLWNHEEKESFLQAYYCRVIRSFTICGRLYFYHRENTKSHQEKQRYVKQVLCSNPYKTAFKEVRLRHLEWRLKIVTLLVRSGLYRGLYLLYLAQYHLAG